MSLAGNRKCSDRPYLKSIFMRLETKPLISMKLPFGLLSLLFLISIPLTFSGCPATPAPAPNLKADPDAAPIDAQVTEESDADAEKKQADDPAAVAVLEEAGVTFQKDSSGNVISADCKAAGITDEQMKHFAGLPHLTKLSLGERRNHECRSRCSL